MIIVTGGAGFIGSNFVLNWVKHSVEQVLVIDSLTYAGNIRNLDSVISNGQVVFSRTDLRDFTAVRSVIKNAKPRAIVHFAAESHVDRSIDGPDDFIYTNVLGTFNLLQTALEYCSNTSFRFIHVSTDEVYGSLNENEPAFTELSAYAPNSPYSASKAASDHLVRAWHHTYGLPTITTNCSNNYGPFQYPEKLIPLIITNAISGKPLPIYGDGKNIRDWLYVEDHCNAIRTVLLKGRIGEVYNIGGDSELTNIEVVTKICTILDELKPRSDGRSYSEQIEFVKDRPGHDRRYAIDASKIKRELGWYSTETFSTGIVKTIEWYLKNKS